VLQSKYANFIPKGPAAAATPAYTSKQDSFKGPVPPIQPGAPTNQGPPIKVSDTHAPGPVQPAANGPLYTVTGDKEMIYEIAQKTLGEGRRWTELWYLNRSVVSDPSRPIPAGTQLRLPGKS
jgi:nucleoid-associated protein YgaU